MIGNRHPADELATVRQQMRELKEQEEALRQQLMELPPVERSGVDYVARVIEKTQRRIDIDALAEELGNIDRFYKATSVAMVYVERLK